VRNNSEVSPDDHRAHQTLVIGTTHRGEGGGGDASSGGGGLGGGGDLGRGEGGGGGGGSGGGDAGAGTGGALKSKFIMDGAPLSVFELEDARGALLESREVRRSASAPSSRHPRMWSVRQRANTEDVVLICVCMLKSNSRCKQGERKPENLKFAQSPDV
jgi:hypothetical protein